MRGRREGGGGRRGREGGEREREVREETEGGREEREGGESLFDTTRLDNPSFHFNIWKRQFSK